MNVRVGMLCLKMAHVAQQRLPILFVSTIATLTAQNVCVILVSLSCKWEFVRPALPDKPGTAENVAMIETAGWAMCGVRSGSAVLKVISCVQVHFSIGMDSLVSVLTLIIELIVCVLFVRWGLVLMGAAVQQLMHYLA